jgi:hypothetical protein
MEMWGSFLSGEREADRSLPGNAELDLTSTLNTIYILRNAVLRHRDKFTFIKSCNLGG